MVPCEVTHDEHVARAMLMGLTYDEHTQSYVNFVTGEWRDCNSLAALPLDERLERLAEYVRKELHDGI